MPLSTGTVEAAYSTGFDIFLNGRDQPFSDSSSIANWTKITEEVFSARFSQLLNTFWLASQSTYTIIDQGGANISSFYNLTTEQPTLGYRMATADILETRPVYQANFVWVALLLVVSLVLFLCALASLVTRLLILAPDMLGFVSTLTKDNALFQEHDVMALSSTLSGQDRARKLRHLRVMIADVRPEDEIGHIALAPVEKEDSERERQTRLRKGRLYD